MSPRFFVLCAPPGSGKSKHAREIAKLLGATSVVDEWDGVSPVPDGALAVTNDWIVQEVADRLAAQFLQPNAS